MKRLLATPFPVVLLAALGFSVSFWNATTSGPLWPDAPRYANAGAMFHDLIAAGEWHAPVDFARRNYATYPGFSMPFHPPVYPFLLGVFLFVSGGVSPISARVFVALSYSVSTILFLFLTRKLAVGVRASFFAAVLFALMPELAKWSRTTMSEIPSLPFVFGSALAFLAWLHTGKRAWCIAFFALAAGALLTRVLSIALLVALCGYGLATPLRKRVTSTFFLGCLGVFLLLVVAWIRFASRFGQFETAEGLNALVHWPALIAAYLQGLPATAGWGLVVSAAFALAAAVWVQSGREMLFPLIWILSCTILPVATRDHHEDRYHVYALIGLPLAVAIGLKVLATRPILQRILTVFAGLSVCMSAMALRNIDAGSVGTREAASQLASFEPNGNILLVTPFDSDIMFHYRGITKVHRRQLLRGDRTLVVRFPDYAKIQQKIASTRVASMEEFLGLLRAGRVRYLVTCFDNRGRSCQREEQRLAHQIATGSPEAFRRLAEFPVRDEFDHCCSLFVWEFLEEPAPGDSELPVVIPTAGIVLDSRGLLLGEPPESRYSSPKVR